MTAGEGSLCLAIIRGCPMFARLLGSFSALLLLWLGVFAATQAGEMKIVLRDYVDQQWSNELLTYPFSAPEKECRVESLTLTNPLGQPVPVQLSDVEFWPGTQSVKAAKLSFIADLAPLAKDTYTVRYGDKPGALSQPATDLKVVAGEGQVEITTGQLGARILLGEQTYAQPVAASEVPGPVIAMRTGDGTWFGGSQMYGPGKLKAYSTKLTDRGPVFARVAIRYTYDNGNTMDVSLRIVAGDNTVRCETNVKRDQPDDGFCWVLSRGLPPLLFQVHDEMRKDREPFLNPKPPPAPLAWAEIPLKDYVGPEKEPYGPVPTGLVTRLTPWEDWFTTFTQTRIRLRLEGTTRELQIRSLDPGAWVDPLKIEATFAPPDELDPAMSLWAGWLHKCMPVVRDAAGEVSLEANAAQGLRKWTVSDCLSVPGMAALWNHYGYQPESSFPPETRPTVGYRLDEVKDYVLQWPGDAGKHPRLFISRPELEARRERQDADPKLLEKLITAGGAASPEQIPYAPNSSYQTALGAYLLSGSPEVAQKTLLVARLRQALAYDLWGTQFTITGAQTAILYDGLIDSPVVPEEEREVLRARMAYFAYRVTDPAVWSAERGYSSANQNMTVTWEISRGLVACAIPEHPMAKVWYDKAQRITEQLLTHMVGPAGEWPEAMSHHGRTSVDMILSFALASTNSGMHDYVSDPRVKRLILNWAKMLTPRDPRPRGHFALTGPNHRFYPAMGRDSISVPGATCGTMARATRTSDPEYSAALQWAWLEEGGSEQFDHLAGFSYVSCDRSLPAKRPSWISEVFPRYGAMLRHGLGTPNEHQVLLYSGDHSTTFYPNHTGSFPSIFAYGMPVAGSFPGDYEYQEGYLTCQVGLARPLGTMAERQAVEGYVGSEQQAGLWGWPGGEMARFGEHGGLANVSSFSALPRQDYAAVDVALHYPRPNPLIAWKTDLPEWPPVPAVGKPPVDWRRQVLFLKDDDPANVAYLLLRDSIKGVKGPQPTMWQMWTVSETLDTPEKVKDVGAVLANKPGYKILPARELQGNRFTAVGQLGVDVEYYIASPTDTPRHTLRWGTDMFEWANKLGQPEYQDLLHLQMRGDGAYFVAFYPRKRPWAVPTFSTLGEGTIIKVAGDFGTDYGFLSALETTAEGEGARFTGTAGSVQDRKTGLVLSLGAKGEVRHKDYGLTSDFPVSLRVGEKTLTVELPAALQPPAFALVRPFPGGTVTVSAPGNWALAKPLLGVKLSKTAAGWVLAVPAGVQTVGLSRGG